jgi:phosphate-selective porin OprO/OprP
MSVLIENLLTQRGIDMKGKAGLLAGVASAALMLSGAAVAATTTTTKTTVRHHRHHTTVKTTTTTSNMDMAQMSGGASGSMPSSAAPAGPSLEERVQRLEEMEQQNQERAEAQRTRLTTLEQNFADTQWTFDNSRPTVKSGDGRFTLALRVRFQADEVNFFQESNVNTVTATHNVQFKDLSSGAQIRRAFFGVEGKAFNDFWYELRYNAGGGGNAETDPALSLARVAYLGIPNFEINAGVIEPAFMFEGTTSSGQLMFMERPEIDNIAADSYGAGDGRRGVELRFQKTDALLPGDDLVLAGDLTGGKTASAAGHGNLGDEQSQLMAHASYRAWSDGISNIAFYGDYSHAFTGGNVKTIVLQDRPQFRVDGDRLISTGNITAKTANMWAAAAGANFENFYVGGEYAHFTVDRDKVLHTTLKADQPDFSGWYVEGSWVLTGEPKTYTATATNNEVGGFGAPKVASPFSLAGDSWGAWELTARYSDTDLNWHEHDVATATDQAGIAGGREKIFLVGMNWYLNQDIKFQVNDAWVKVDKLASAGSVVQVGQNLNILGMRLQFTN